MMKIKKIQFIQNLQHHSHCSIWTSCLKSPKLKTMAPFYSEVINAFENIKISSLTTKQQTKLFQEVLSSRKLFKKSLLVKQEQANWTIRVDSFYTLRNGYLKRKFRFEQNLYVVDSFLQRTFLEDPDGIYYREALLYTFMNFVKCLSYLRRIKEA